MKAQKAVMGCVFLCAIARGMTVRADDGELFPNVKNYDEQVASPVSKPEKAVEVVKPAVKEPVERPKHNGKGPKEPPTDKEPKVPVPVAKIPEVRWEAYRVHLLSPLMSPESQSRFDSEFAPKVQAVLKEKGKGGKEAADSLWKDAEAAGIAADLKRGLWLHALGLAIRGQTELDDRAAKAKAVLPLLTEETLPVAQARADAVTELAFGAPSRASDALLAIVVESQCKLARLQVQGGFPDQAAGSMKMARDAYVLMNTKTDSAKDAMTEAGAWVDRATAARGQSSHWQETLAAKPTDAMVNTQLAVLTLSLYGDVEKAAAYAGKSDRKELLAFGAAVEKVKSASGDRAPSTAEMLTVAGALLDVADGGAVQPFDRYSIAMLVAGKLTELSAAGDVKPDQATTIKTMQSRDAALATRSGIKSPAYVALASLTGTGKGGGTPADSAKLQLFVKDNGTVVKYIKPTAKQDAEALALIRKQAKMISDKISIPLTEIETPHCLVFTDWEPAEQGFLKKNVEGAYLSAAKMFDFPVNENVFPGKLPVYVLTKKEVFVALNDALGKPGMDKYIGTFDVTDEGIGYGCMYRASPSKSMNAQECLMEFGRTLSWNMTDAFVARYRTNKDLPSWLSKGLAAHVSFSQFAQENQKNAIQRFLWKKRSVGAIFTDGSRDFDSDAVAASIVEMLLAKDAKAFVQLINKVKDGEVAETALKETYKLGYADTEKLWNAWINGK